ncbi:tyrosine-type recombinase/integrase [Pseudomonas marginalis]|nr:tyrosine-type recombinase/integrase [Pseudomonas marginalis]
MLATCGIWAHLQTCPEIAARALQLIILSACRSTEVLSARWQDVDWRQQVWTIPAATMRSGRDHSVPVVPAIAVLLGGLRGLSLEWVIPRNQTERSFPGVRLITPLRRMGCHETTPYAFRRGPLFKPSIKKMRYIEHWAMTPCSRRVIHPFGPSF